MLYRITVLLAHLPPLRERKEDIPHLMNQLLVQSNRNYSVEKGVMEKLKQHNWPGNIRELRNVLQRALVLSGGHIQEEHIMFFTLENIGSRGSVGILKKNNQRERLRIDLEEQDGNVSALAREYGIARSTLVYRLKRYNLIE